MPEFNLPGVSNNIDVKSIIDKLVEVESKKLDRLTETRERFDREKASLANINNKIEALQNAAASLHGFRSPFEDKLAFSNNENIVISSATRTAVPSKISVRVEQLAQNEKILSDPIETKRIFEDIPLKITIGGREVVVYFKGGRIEELNDAINKQAGDYLASKITEDTERTSVLILETKESGEKNRITMADENTAALFKEIGLLKEAEGLKIDLRLSEKNVVPLKGSMGYSFSEKRLMLEPENSVELLLEKSLEAKPSYLLRVKLKASDVSAEEAPLPLEWPRLKSIGKVTVKDIEIEGGRAISDGEEEPKKEEKPSVVDNMVIGVGNEKGLQRMIEVSDLDESLKEYTFKLTDMVQEGESIDRLFLINRSTGRAVEYADMIIEDTAVREGFVPKHQIQEGRDAIAYIDGVKVQRDDNVIDDAVKGVKFELRGSGEQEVTVTVERDYEKITQKIVELIQKYNELLEFINEQTKVVSTGRLSEGVESGVLTGDITIMGLKNKLQTIMMNPYPTDKGRELSLLAQIGISMGATGSSWGSIKGGYLQLDEERFISSFEKYPDTIKQLFGSDTNNDAIVDNGVAFALEKNLKAYSDPRNGIITYRIKNTDTKIRDQQVRIDDWNEHLEEYRKKLEKDFTLMQEALRELEQQQKSLENFSKQFRNE